MSALLDGGGSPSLSVRLLREQPRLDGRVEPDRRPVGALRGHSRASDPVAVTQAVNSSAMVAWPDGLTTL
jgi:hypothetical protein